MNSLEMINSGRRPSEALYDARYQESLRNYITREALPSESNYRNLYSIVQDKSERPTLDYLYESTVDIPKGGGAEGETPEEGEKLQGKVIKFGWIIGVLMPCILNIWGVTLFLRVSWMVGEAGIIYGGTIVLLSHFITVVTTLSMSAVATNGQIQGGGIYYMISRSLGPEFGGSIGLVFTVANAIASSAHTIGFVISLQDMCKDYFSVNELIPGLGGGTNDIRILGTATLILLVVLAIVGMDWVARVQEVLLVLLLGAQMNFIVGSFMGPKSDLERAQGFVGYNGEVFVENLKTDYRYMESYQNFFVVFGVFFPGVTGLVAGANLSGDLKDPSHAIPIGTLVAIAFTGACYFFYAIMIGGAVVRHATGNLTQFLEFENFTTSDSVYDNPAYNISSCGLYETGQSMCAYGTQNNFQIIELMSAWGPLIYIGCFAATLSSAIASLIGAPRVLQALAKDKLYPYIHVFAQGWGANNDPFRGYFLVSLVAFACIMIAELNAVSSLLTNCFLASYALINISCFHASFTKSPGWRPSFKFYNMWLSLVGGFLCVVVMFLIDWVTALITVIITAALYKYVEYRKPDVNWGSSTQAQTYISALKSTLDLTVTEEHVKNYRPQILLLSGNPWTRPSLIDFANVFTKNVSLLSCANIVKDSLTSNERSNNSRLAYTWFIKHKIRAFYDIMEAKSLQEGTKSVLQVSGLGKLRPNIVFLGFKSNWKSNKKELREYFTMIQDFIFMHYGIAILRVRRGFDYSSVLAEDPSVVLYEKELPNGAEVPDEIENPDEREIPNGIELSKANGTKKEEAKPGSSAKKLEQIVDAFKLSQKKKKDSSFVAADGSELSQEVLNELTMFQQKQTGYIDVWWLYDDGGLTLLLPYILQTRNQWSTCKMRVFALANRKQELELEQRSMANLLAKFRIEFSDLIIVPDIAKRASRSIRIEFDELIKEFKTLQSEENQDLFISDADLTGSIEKTNRHLRLRELLLENSKNSSLVVMTLPIPRKNAVNASLYMAWLDILSMDMPPFLFVRGNQTSVLTYYS